MAAKQMKFGVDARAEIGNGLSQLSRAVKATLDLVERFLLPAGAS